MWEKLDPFQGMSPFAQPSEFPRSSGSFGISFDFKNAEGSYTIPFTTLRKDSSEVQRTFQHSQTITRVDPQ